MSVIKWSSTMVLQEKLCWFDPRSLRYPLVPSFIFVKLSMLSQNIIALDWKQLDILTPRKYRRISLSCLEMLVLEMTYLLNSLSSRCWATLSLCSVLICIPTLLVQLLVYWLKDDSLMLLTRRWASRFSLIIEMFLAESSIKNVMSFIMDSSLIRLMHVEMFSVIKWSGYLFHQSGTSYNTTQTW